MSCDGWAALPRGATGCLQFVIVVFPDHTHLLFLLKDTYNKISLGFNVQPTDEVIWRLILGYGLEYHPTREARDWTKNPWVQAPCIVALQCSKRQFIMCWLIVFIRAATALMGLHIYVGSREPLLLYHGLNSKRNEMQIYIVSRITQGVIVTSRQRLYDVVVPWRIYLSIHLSIFWAVVPSICPSTCLSVYISIFS